MFGNFISHHFEFIIYNVTILEDVNLRVFTLVVRFSQNKKIQLEPGLLSVHTVIFNTKPKDKKDFYDMYFAAKLVELCAGLNALTVCVYI